MKVIMIQPDGTQREMKRCSYCHEIKEKTEFYKTSSHCKFCQKMNNRKRVRVR